MPRSEATIGESSTEDHAAILALYPRAFPDEDLKPLVTALLDDPTGALSFVARLAGNLVGHMAMTPCGLEEQLAEIALLGPLAVDPRHQRRGIGKALIEEGLRQLRERGIVKVCVLGDPAYYGRSGFNPETGIKPPYPLPDEWQTAWQSLSLTSKGEAMRGLMTVPAFWRDPALWGA